MWIFGEEMATQEKNNGISHGIKTRVMKRNREKGGMRFKSLKIKIFMEKKYGRIRSIPKH